MPVIASPATPLSPKGLEGTALSTYKVIPILLPLARADRTKNGMDFEPS